MRHLKAYEDINENGWLIPIDNIIDHRIFHKIPDISDKVKEGDIVIGVWFTGSFDTYLLKLIKSEGELGVITKDSWFGVEYAWGIFDLKDYKKYDPEFETKVEAKKYNL